MILTGIDKDLRSKRALRRKNRAVAFALVGTVALFYFVFIVRAGVI